MIMKNLSEIAYVFGGHSFRTKAEAATGCIKLIQIKDIQAGIFGDFSSLPFADLSEEKLKFNLKTNDILLPLRGERIAAMMIDNENNVAVTTTNQIAIIRIYSNLITPEYLLYFLNAPKGINLINELQGNGLVTNLSIKKLTTLTLPIPSLDIQYEVINLHNMWTKQKETLCSLIENGSALCHATINKLIYKGE
ncbi:Restriction endonuclease subunit M [Escherichia coli]|jgi:hypothetical protein|nr:restriction endonuclease subunit S [Escherichia sp. 79.0191]